jgi:hypothetical protein
MQAVVHERLTATGPRRQGWQIASAGGVQLFVGAGGIQAAGAKVGA